MEPVVTSAVDSVPVDPEPLAAQVQQPVEVIPLEPIPQSEPVVELPVVEVFMRRITPLQPQLVEPVPVTVAPVALFEEPSPSASSKPQLHQQRQPEPQLPQQPPKQEPHQSARTREDHTSLQLTSRSQASLMVVTSNHPRSPKWTLRGRFWAGERQVRKIPGPGAYESQPLQGNYPGAFAKTPRFMEARKEKAPGVGAYEPKFSLLEPQPLRVPFGSSTRPGIASRSQSLVGPGSYVIPSMLTESPGVSLKGRNWVKASKSVVINVGPGEYKLPPIRSTAGKLFSFSKTPRNPGWTRKFTAPAVGTYDIRAWNSLGSGVPKISLSGRPKNWNMPARTAGGTLGPGQYNAATTSFGY